MRVGRGEGSDRVGGDGEGGVVREGGREGHRICFSEGEKSNGTFPTDNRKRCTWGLKGLS